MDTIQKLKAERRILLGDLEYRIEALNYRVNKEEKEPTSLMLGSITLLVLSLEKIQAQIEILEKTAGAQ